MPTVNVQVKVSRAAALRAGSEPGTFEVSIETDGLTSGVRSTLAGLIEHGVEPLRVERADADTVLQFARREWEAQVEKQRADEERMVAIRHHARENGPEDFVRAVETRIGPCPACRNYHGEGRLVWSLREVGWVGERNIPLTGWQGASANETLVAEARALCDSRNKAAQADAARRLRDVIGPACAERTAKREAKKVARAEEWGAIVEAFLNDEQKERRAAGVLSPKEMRETVQRELFAPVPLQRVGEDEWPDRACSCDTSDLMEEEEMYWSDQLVHVPKDVWRAKKVCDAKVAAVAFASGDVSTSLWDRKTECPQCGETEHMVVYRILIEWPAGNSMGQDFYLPTKGGE